MAGGLEPYEPGELTRPDSPVTAERRIRRIPRHMRRSSRHDPNGHKIPLVRRLRHWLDFLPDRILDWYARRILHIRPLTPEEERILNTPGLQQEVVRRLRDGLPMETDEQRFVLHWLILSGAA